MSRFVIFGAGFKTQSPLADGREHCLEPQTRREGLCQSQSCESGAGKDDCIVVALGKFIQSRVDIPAYISQVQVWTQV
jgi:hypothetical protein